MAHLSFNSRLIVALHLDLGIVMEDSLLPQESGIPHIPSACLHDQIFEDYGGCSSCSYLDNLGNSYLLREQSWFSAVVFPFESEWYGRVAFISLLSIMLGKWSIWSCCVHIRNQRHECWTAQPPFHLQTPASLTPGAVLPTTKTWVFPPAINLTDIISYKHACHLPGGSIFFFNQADSNPDSGWQFRFFLSI